MIHIAIQYFNRYGHLDIPGVGQLKLLKKESVLQNEILKAPTEIIEFEMGEGKVSKLFYQYIANSLEISADQAAIQYDQFWNQQIKEASCIEVGSLGTITILEGNYLWRSSYDSNNYHKDIPLDQFPYKEILEEVQATQNKDRWGIWAMVLAVLALLAILLK